MFTTAARFFARRPCCAHRRSWSCSSTGVSQRFVRQLCPVLAVWCARPCRTVLSSLPGLSMNSMRGYASHCHPPVGPVAHGLLAGAFRLPQPTACSKILSLSCARGFRTARPFCAFGPKPSACRRAQLAEGSPDHLLTAFLAHNIYTHLPELMPHGGPFHV